MTKPLAPGMVWARAIITVGPQMDYEVIHAMPANFTLADLRAKIAAGYNWTGFGLPSAQALDASGNVLRNLSVGIEPEPVPA